MKHQYLQKSTINYTAETLVVSGILITLLYICGYFESMFALTNTLLFNINAFVVSALSFLISWHLFLGIKEIVMDYIHHTNTQYWIYLCLSIISLVTAKYIFFVVI